MWVPRELVEVVARGLREAQKALDREQAVYGLDGLAELELHPVIEQVIAGAGIPLVREQPYPGNVSRRLKRTARERCDLVLLPPGVEVLGDPVARLKELDRARETLFAGQAEAMLQAEPVAGPEDAFWLEVKVVGQHTLTHGVCGPNGAYGGELAAALADLAKIARDPVIRFGGLLLVLFNDSDATAQHDLRALTHRALDRDLPTSVPDHEGFAISDRIGNARCTVAIFPARCTLWMAGTDSD